MDPFNIVKDSSIWFNSDNFSAMFNRDPVLRIGVVKKAVNDKATGELRYLVEVQSFNNKIELNCTMLRRFGGVYNYEDVVYRGYTINDKPDPVSSFEAKAGDAVLVGQINGQGRQGIILGGITHAARTKSLSADNGPEYKSEFNGIEKYINKDGEYIVTFKAQPTNLNELLNQPKDKLKEPTYDASVGTSYYKFDKQGSWTVSDNSQTGIQSFKLDKPNGVVELLSGKVSLKISKKPESVEWVCKTMDTKAQDKISATTKEFTVDATTRTYIKTPKVAIGTDAIELLDQLAQLVDAIGTVMPISPVGQCTVLKSSPGWPQVESVKAKIKQITGSF